MFGPKAEGIIVDHVKGLLEAQRSEIDRAILLCDKNVKINIGITIVPSDGKNNIKTKLSFVKERVSDQFEEMVDDSEPALRVAK